MQLDMTKGKPLPVILQFTIPLVIGNIFQQLYNMADTIIVGRYVGAGALAAVGSTGTIMFLATGFAQGITAGFSILTAQRYGAEHRRDRLGQICRPGCSCHTHAAADDKKQIQTHVQAGGKYQEKEWDLTVSHRPQIGGKQVVEDICRESDADSHDIRVGILKDI